MFDSSLTVVELSLVLAGESLTVLDTFLPTVETSSTECLTADSAVVVKCLDKLESFFTVEADLTVASEPVSTAIEGSEPISSMRTVFSGFCICNSLQ